MNILRFVLYKKKMIAIIAAMENEIVYLKEKIADMKEQLINQTRFFIGKLAEKEVVLVKCGIGKVMSAVTTTLLIEHFHPDMIINVGVAGGMKSDASVLDLVISRYISYYDVDITSFGDLAYGQMANMPAYFQADKSLVDIAMIVAAEAKLNHHLGDILSGDSFVTNAEYMGKIVKDHFSHFNVVAVDMESASIAQVAYVLNIPFIIIRALSDKIGEHSQSMTYNDFVDLAAKNASILVEEVLKKI